MTLSQSRLPTPDERRLELEEMERAVRREIRWVYARAVGGCLLSMAVGLGAVLWSVHSTDEGYAQIAFWSGLLVGNAGILITLLVTFHRAMEEGWL